MPGTLYTRSEHKYQVRFTRDQNTNTRYVLHEIRTQIPGMLHTTSDQRECASFLRYQNIDKTSRTLLTKADHYLMSGTLCSQSEQIYQVRFVRNHSRYIRYALSKIRTDISGTLCPKSEHRCQVRFAPDQSSEYGQAYVLCQRTAHRSRGQIRTFGKINTGKILYARSSPKAWRHDVRSIRDYAKCHRCLIFTPIKQQWN